MLATARLVCRDWQLAVDEARLNLDLARPGAGADGPALARLIEKSTGLESLTLRLSATVMPQLAGAVECIAAAVRQHKSLASIAVCGDLRVGGAEAAALVEAAAARATRISLEDLPLDPPAAAAVARAVRLPRPRRLRDAAEGGSGQLGRGRRLEELRVVRVGADAALAALGRLVAGGRLRALRLSGTRLGGEGCAAALAGPLRDPRCGLEALLVARCGLGPDGCLALLAAAAGHARLASLALYGEAVGSGPGAEAAAALLSSHPALRSCTLAACGLATEGAVRLVQAALGHPQRPLAVLDITGNAVAAEGQGKIYTLSRHTRLTVRVSW
eukprot:tig00000342_g24232.t1